MRNTSIEQENASIWFEPLYAQAKGDSTQIPWAKNKAHPYLKDWLETYQFQARGKSALVVGCGLGDDAEALSSLDYQVTAFDIAPTAITWCKQRFPDSLVNYLVADLFALDRGWQKQFDLVYDCRNIQALPLNVRPQVVEKIASLVAVGGTLLIITHHRDNNSMVSDKPPWALSDEDLSLFEELGLEEIRRDNYLDRDHNTIKQLRIEYRRNMIA